jgi:hypothetical protein
MAPTRASKELQGRGSDGVRSVDYLETGIRTVPQWIFGIDRPSVHVAVRPSRRALHPLRSWSILAFITFNVGATAACWYIKWRYG